MHGRNEIGYADNFWKDIDKLPREAQKKLGGLLEIFAENPFDPRLHTKPLAAPLKERYSFRIVRDWRVAFRFTAQYQIKLLIADHRDSIYQRLKRSL